MKTKEILIIVGCCVVAYLPFVGKGVTYDDFVFLDYAKKLTKNPTVAVVDDMIFQGLILEDLVVFESTHPPFIPYFIRVVTHLAGENLVLLHLAFLPFLILASLSLGALIFRYTQQTPVLALGLTLGPLFLPIATNLMTDVALFGFWFSAMWFWELALEQKERWFSWPHIATGLAVLCSIFTSYQGLGLVVVLFLRCTDLPQLKRAAFWSAMCLGPFLLWVLLVYRNYGFIPYFSPPREEVSIATEVAKGMDWSNVTLKTRAMILYLGTGLLFLLPWLFPKKAAWWWITAAGWGLALSSYLFPNAFWGVQIQGWMTLTAGLMTLPLVASAARAAWKETGSRRHIFLALLGSAAGFALFQTAVAALAAPRYLFVLLGALWILGLTRFKCQATVSKWAILLPNLILGLLVTWADWQYADAQRVEKLGLPNLPIHFAGEKGVKYSAENLGYRYFLPQRAEEVSYLLVTEEIDRIPVPSTLLEQGEIIAQYPINSSLPIRVMNRDAHAGLYIHSRGLLPFSFSRNRIEHYRLYKCYQPGHANWQGDEYHPKPAGQILPDRPLSQDFTCQKDGLSAFRLYFATYARRNESTLKVSLTELDEQGLPGTEVFSEIVDARTIEDNRYRRFEFQPLASLGKRYRLTLSSPDATPATAVTVWSNTNSEQTYQHGQQTLKGALGFESFCLPARF